jgi:hypothetical protein
VVAVAGVVLHAVIRRKNNSRLDGPIDWTRSFEVKSIVSAMSGRNVSGFGTVRPRVQIPGPRPNRIQVAVFAGSVQASGSRGDHRLLATLRKSLRTHGDTREAVRLQATRRTTQYIANARTRIASPPRIADSMD